MNILKWITGIFGSYIVIGLILIKINPLFSWIVLAPVFYVQDIFGKISDVGLIYEKQKIQTSDTILPDKLTKIICSGEAVYTADVVDVSSYYVELKANENTSQVLACETPYGIFVIHYHYPFGGDLRTDLYRDLDGLYKITTFMDKSINLAVDDRKNLYVLEPLMEPYSSIVDKTVYIVNPNENILKKVVRNGPLQVCVIPFPQFSQEEKCDTWPFDTSVYQ